MLAVLNNIKGMVIAVVVILLLLAGIYFAGKWSKGNKEGTPAKIKPGQLPNAGRDIPQSWSPSTMSDKLYDSMNGLNMFGGNAKVFQEYAQLLTDDMFTAVFLDFNSRYPGKGTLRDWVQDEYSFTLPAIKWRDAVLERMDQLQLT